MTLTKETLQKLTETEFELLLNIIGDDSLRKNLIKLAPTLPKTSIYHFSSKSEGAFWKGFRKEKILISKVKKFYFEEVFKSTSNFEILDDFSDMLLVALGVSDNDIEEKIYSYSDGKYYEVLCKVFEINVDGETINLINEKQKLQRDFEQKILLIEEEQSSIIAEIKRKDYEVIEKANEQINKLNQNIAEYKKEINDLKINLEKQIKHNSEVKEQLISDVLSKTGFNEEVIKSFIDSLFIKNKKYLVDVYNKNILSSILNDNMENTEEVKKKLLINYILLCIMEDKLI